MAFVIKRNDKDENNSTEKKRKKKFFSNKWHIISQKGMLKLTKSGLSLKANSCKRTV